MMDKVLEFLEKHRLGVYVVSIAGVAALWVAEESIIGDLQHELNQQTIETARYRQLYIEKGTK